MFNKTFATATLCLGMSLGLGLASTSAAQTYKSWAGRNVTAVQELLAEGRKCSAMRRDMKKALREVEGVLEEDGIREANALFFDTAYVYWWTGKEANCPYAYRSYKNRLVSFYNDLHGATHLPSSG